MNVKGKLLIIGGKEDRSDNHIEMKESNKNFSPLEILKLLADSKKDRIEVITTASSEPEDLVKSYKETFSRIGFSNFGFMHIGGDSDDESYIQRVRESKTVFFTGGDQNKICEELLKSPIKEVLQEKYMLEEDFMIAGTSAGAMCMPEIIISEAENGEAMINNDLEVGKGLGLLTNALVDTHFVHRGRFGRLAHTVLKNQELYGLGLGEDTALLIENGNHAVCKGSGMVIIISAKNIVQTNVESARKHCPIYAENLQVHLLTDGCSFNLADGTMTAADCSEKVHHQNRVN
jgi:cyanophycinase